MRAEWPEPPPFEPGPAPRAVAHPPGAIYARTPDGGLRCVLCDRLDGTHAVSCAVSVVRVQIQELTAELGMFVATMRETLDTVDRLLREGDTPS